MEHTSDLPLSLKGNNIWRGQNLTNGRLELMSPHIQSGYAKLVISSALAAVLTAAGEDGVPFGNAVWYDRHVKSSLPNVVYAGQSTATNAVPRLAGIMAYDAGTQSAQPVFNKGVMPYNKGKIIKYGFVRYKFGLSSDFATTLKYADIDDSQMVLFARNTTGEPVFAVPTGFNLDGRPTLSGCTFIGNIVLSDPDDRSVLVEVDVGRYQETAGARVTISMLAVPGVTAPVKGATPVTSVDTAQYSGTVAWSPNDATFGATTVYTATITLTPKTGYSVANVVANSFTVTGATATNSANSGVITAVFPATGA